MLENFIQQCNATTCSVIPVSFATQVSSSASFMHILTLVKMFGTNVLKQVLHGLLSALVHLDTHSILHRVIVFCFNHNNRFLTLAEGHQERQCISEYH